MRRSGEATSKSQTAKKRKSNANVRARAFEGTSNSACIYSTLIPPNVGNCNIATGKLGAV